MTNPHDQNHLLPLLPLGKDASIRCEPLEGWP
jgi:hypothetical protein